MSATYREASETRIREVYQSNVKNTGLAALVSAATVGGPLAIEYQLESDLGMPAATVTIQYSTNAGVDWDDCTGDTSDPSHEGNTNLSAGEAGTSHTFIWAAATDLGGGFNDEIFLRLRCYDGTYYDQWLTAGAFIVNLLPSTAISSPAGGSYGEPISIAYNIISLATDLTFSVNVQYAEYPGATWYDCTGMTSDPTHEGTSGLSDGVHVFVWDSLTDLTAAFVGGPLILRVKPHNGVAWGSYPSSEQFTVNMAPSVAMSGPVSGKTYGSPIVASYAISTLRTGVTFAATLHYQAEDELGWAACTPVAGHAQHEVPTGLSAGTHQFVWDCYADLGANVQRDIALRCQAYDGSRYSNLGYSEPVSVDLLPAVSSVALTGGGAPLYASYALSCRVSDLSLTVDAQYSTDDGDTWSYANYLASDPLHDGLSGLLAGEHTYVWDSLTNLGASYVGSTVQIRLRAHSGVAYGAYSSSRNYAISMIPVVTLTAPTSGVFGDPIDLQYAILDNVAGMTYSVDAEYSINDGVDWSDATPKTSDPDHDGVSGLNAGEWVWVWDAVSDLGADSVGTAIVVRLRAHDGTAWGEFSTSPRFAVQMPPMVSLQSPGAGAVNGSPTSVEYTITTYRSISTFSASVEYTDDAGENWYTCTADSGDVDHEGLTGLSTGSHTFIWNTIADLAASFCGAVSVRVRAHDGAQYSAWVESSESTANMLTAANRVTVPSTGSGTVYVSYDLISHVPALSHSIETEYCVDAGAWTTATPDTGDNLHDGISGLSPGAHVFVWNALANLGASFESNDATLRMRAYNGTAWGGYTSSTQFSLIIIPTITLTAPVNGTYGTPIDLVYTIGVSDDDLTYSVDPEYTIDAGDNWYDCTADAAGEGHEGATGLSSGSHKFVWDALTDLGTGFAMGDVQVRIRGHNGTTWGAYANSDIFRSCMLPTANLTAPRASTKYGSPIPITYAVSTLRTVTAFSATLQYTDDAGENWYACTADTGSVQHEVPTDLASGEHVFVWDTLADLGGSFDGPAQLRVTTNDGDQDSPWALSDSLTISMPSSVSYVDVATAIGAPVPVEYAVASLVPTAVNSVEAEYSINGGVDWDDATALAADPAHDGVSGLSVGAHTFVWDSVTDLGDSYQGGAVRARMRTHNGSLWSGYTSTGDFSVDMHPTVTLTAPQAGSYNTTPIAITYTIETLMDLDSFSVEVEFSVDDGSTWLTCLGDEAHELHDGVEGLPVGGGVFVWKAVSDLPTGFSEANVLARVRANDGTNSSSYSASGAFEVNLLVGQATLISPFDAFFDAGDEAQFSWYIPQDAGGQPFHFNLEIDSQSDGSPVIDDDTVTGYAHFRHQITASPGMKAGGSNISYYVRGLEVSSNSGTAVTYAALEDYFKEAFLPATLTNPKILLVNRADRFAYIPPASITATGFTVYRRSFGSSGSAIVDLLIYAGEVVDFDSYWVTLTITGDTSLTYGVAPLDVDDLGRSIPSEIANCRPELLEGSDWPAYIDSSDDSGINLKKSTFGVGDSPQIMLQLKEGPSEAYQHRDLTIEDDRELLVIIGSDLTDATNDDAPWPSYIPGAIVSVAQRSIRPSYIALVRGDHMRVHRCSYGTVGASAVDLFCTVESDNSIPYYNDVSPRGVPDSYKGGVAKYTVAAADDLPDGRYQWRVWAGNEAG